jgi:SP family general alpha glucoside:H+ symporter-like MFS transporter
MSSGIIKPKDESSEGEQVDKVYSKGEHVSTLYPDVLVNPDLLGDAVDGENREHEMSLWTAVKTHPWACLWAFTMCFTIVSLP